MVGKKEESGIFIFYSGINMIFYSKTHTIKYSSKVSRGTNSNEICIHSMSDKCPCHNYYLHFIDEETEVQTKGS